jgi:fibronectin type 3 domain-containing protein
VVVSGAGFSANGVAAGTALTPNQSTTLNVAFAPGAAGSASGTVTVNSNASSPATVSVSGTGVQLTTHSVALSWTASTSSGAAGYNVYRGTASSGPYSIVSSSLVAATQYTDTTVQSGQTYYYVVTAVDSSNAESVYSNQAPATIP